MLTCVRSGAKLTLGSPQSGQFRKPLELAEGGLGHIKEALCGLLGQTT